MLKIFKLNIIIKKSIFIASSMIVLTNVGHAKSISEPVATIGQFSILKENCKSDGSTCDYNLYKGNTLELPLVEAWERGLNIEQNTTDFLHVSYGYTFNTHHDIFISKQGDVDTYDDFMAIDPKTGCVARFTNLSWSVPSLFFNRLFENKLIEKFDLEPDDFEDDSSTYMMILKYFSDIEFDDSGAINYNFKMKSGEMKAVTILNPCGADSK